MEKSGLIIHQLPRSKGWGITAWPHPSPHPHLQDYGGLILFVRVTVEIVDNWKWHRCQPGWSGSGGECSGAKGSGYLLITGMKAFQCVNDLYNCFHVYWLSTNSVQSEGDPMQGKGSPGSKVNHI